MFKTKKTKKTIETDKTYDVIKMIYDKDKFDWTSDVYLSFLDYNLFPQMTLNYPRIIYNIPEKFITLNEYLQNHIITNSTMEKLFGFVNTLKKYELVHGNLNFYNIYIHTIKYDFLLIDYYDSYILNKKFSYSYTRSSFLNESNKEIYLLHWDIFTLYVSLKISFKKQLKNLESLNKLITKYINDELLNKMLIMFIKKSSNNI